MRRRIAVALAAALALPVVASAQDIAPPPQQRFTISPFLGYAFNFHQKGTVRFTDSKGTYVANYVRDVAGGTVPGVSVEYKATNRFGVQVAGAYNRRGEESLSTDFVELAPLFSPGGTFWFARAAVSMDFYEGDDDVRLFKPSAQVSVGPALVREVPALASGRLASNSFAVHAAASGELPLPWKGFSVRGAFEDYMSYLPHTEVAFQLGTDVSQQLGQLYAAELSSGPTHMYMVRAGISYRF
jgi:hypothetical protein